MFYVFYFAFFGGLTFVEDVARNISFTIAASYGVIDTFTFINMPFEFFF